MSVASSFIQASDVNSMEVIRLLIRVTAVSRLE